MIYAHEGALYDNRLKSYLSFLSFFTWHHFEYCIFGLSSLLMILWYGRRWTVGRSHGRLQTTDHENLWQVDGGVRLHVWTVHLMNGNGRQTMIICPRWTEVDGGRRQTVHLMDWFRRRTIKNIKMWTEVDGWTDGRKSVRGGLIQWSLLKNSFDDCSYSGTINWNRMHGFSGCIV